MLRHARTHSYPHTRYCDHSRSCEVNNILMRLKTVQSLDLRIVGNACHSVYSPDENFTTQQTVRGHKDTNDSVAQTIRIFKRIVQDCLLRVIYLLGDVP